MDFNFLFTSLEGRINRAKWWAGIVIVAVISLLANFLIVALLGPTSVAAIILFIIQLALTYPAYTVGAKRFQDRDKPGNLALIGPAVGLLYNLLVLVGVINPLAPGALGYIVIIALAAVGIWYLIELGILRGTVGANQFGPDPLEGR